MCNEKKNNKIVRPTSDLDCGCGCIGFSNSKERNKQQEKKFYPTTGSLK